MTLRFVIIGGGPAGNTAALHGVRLGAEVTMIERDVVGGAANLWDCIPSKAMIATGGAMSFMRRAEGMGLGEVTSVVDLDGLRNRISSITGRLERSVSDLLENAGVRIISGTARLAGPNQVLVDTPEGDGGEQRGQIAVEADAILLAMGSSPRIPAWADMADERILSTRDAYPPAELPSHLVVIGSGVTGVEFVHMFRSLGSEVTLIVSRQQVLPQKDPEVAAALEENFLSRGVNLLKGAKAVGIDRVDDAIVVRCTDGRVVDGSHALLAIGSVPNSDDLGLADAGVKVNEWGYLETLGHHLQTTVPHIYVAGDLSGKLPLASVAAMQGRKVAEHVMGMHAQAHRHVDYDKAASAIFTEPEIADVGLAEADAFALGRKIRVTKVPFATTAKALINDDPRGFIKIVSDPITGVILGGSIVGRHAAELISVLALAVNNRLRVTDIAESLLVHPSLAEALSEAAE